MTCLFKHTGTWKSIKKSLPDPSNLRQLSLIFQAVKIDVHYFSHAAYRRNTGGDPASETFPGMFFSTAAEERRGCASQIQIMFLKMAPGEEGSWKTSHSPP